MKYFIGAFSNTFICMFLTTPSLYQCTPTALLTIKVYLYSLLLFELFLSLPRYLQTVDLTYDIVTALPSTSVLLSVSV